MLLGTKKDLLHTFVSMSFSIYSLQFYASFSLAAMHRSVHDSNTTDEKITHSFAFDDLTDQENPEFRYVI